MGEDEVLVKIGRDKVLTFLNTAPKSTASYGLLGMGVTTGQIAMNANTTSEQYIHQTTAYNSIDSYAPTFGVTQTAYKGDAVYDFVFNLYINRATQSDAETDILNVYLAETSNSAFLAERQKVAIEISNYGGDAGEPVSIEYVIHFNGNHEKGTATITDGVPTFTPDSTASL